MSQNNASTGIGFGGALAILFIGLKLAGVIAWSWWWILSPIWIPVCLVIIIVLIVLFVNFLINLF